MKNKEIAGKTMQDVGMCISLGALLISAVVFANANTELYVENLIMLIGIFVSVLLANFRLVSVAIVMTAIQTVSYAAFKIYMLFVAQEQIEVLSYLWILLPGLAVFGTVFFRKGLSKLQMENEILKGQVDELVMIDPITGFYNLRSMFMDIQTQISYAERNESAISLMIVKLRYNKELKSVLKKPQYEEVLKRLAKCVYDTVRLEDRVYSIDKEGSLGVILTCNKAGTKLVENRLRNKLDDSQTFDGISDSPIRVEVKIGYLEYIKAEFQRDAKLFKECVEEEVEYDV